MNLNRLQLLVIHSDIAGRGVIATQDIRKDDTIEICPVLILPPKDVPIIHQTYLHDYYFSWENDQCAICLGYGSIYNHARQPNADYKMDYAQQTIDFFALRDIPAGEEITVSYLHSNKSEGELWFEVE